jgi:diadenosine tetraphosphatase ApaH/serine/threonine PP2A family protein phosphatase
MRIGIFSDTHGNLAALEAVLATLRAQGCDTFACIGDTVGYGPLPNECCTIVRNVASVVIKGNHDAAVARDMDYSYYYLAARRALDHHHDILAADNLEWLKSLPYEGRIGEVYFTHGSPIDPLEFEYVFTPEQAAACLEVWERLGKITFVGHSHLCKSFAVSQDRERAFEVVTTDFEVRPGFRYVVSVGSVGQPRDRDARAACVVYDVEDSRCRFLRVPYDIDATAKLIYMNPHLADSFATRLFAGV